MKSMNIIVVKLLPHIPVPMSQVKTNLMSKVHLYTRSFVSRRRWKEICRQTLIDFTYGLYYATCSTFLPQPHVLSTWRDSIVSHMADAYWQLARTRVSCWNGSKNIWIPFIVGHLKLLYHTKWIEQWIAYIYLCYSNIKTVIINISGTKYVPIHCRAMRLQS